MPDYSDDSDEEIGAYIYSTSHTAQLFREEAAAARNNELSPNNDDNINITMHKRKSPHEHEVENNTSVSSEPKRIKKKRKIRTCSTEGCANQVIKGGVCKRH